MTTREQLAALVGVSAFALVGWLALGGGGGAAAPATLDVSADSPPTPERTAPQVSPGRKPAAGGDAPRPAFDRSASWKGKPLSHWLERIVLRSKDSAEDRRTAANLHPDWEENPLTAEEQRLYAAYQEEKDAWTAVKELQPPVGIVLDAFVAVLRSPREDLYDEVWEYLRGQDSPEGLTALFEPALAIALNPKVFEYDRRVALSQAERASPEDPRLGRAILRLMRDPEVMWAVADHLGDDCLTYSDEVCAMLRSDDEDQVGVALRALEHCTVPVPDAVPILLELLDRDADIRVPDALAAMGPMVLPPLLDRLNGPAARSHDLSMAITMLAKAHAGVREELKRRLEATDDVEARALLLDALTPHAGADAVTIPALREMLHDDARRTRQRATRLVFTMGAAGKPLHGRVLELLEDDDDGVEAAALFVALHTRPLPANRLLDTLSQGTAVMEYALTIVTEPEAHVLLNAAAGFDGERRRRFVQLLASAPAGWQRYLARYAWSQHPEMRRLAREALRTIQNAAPDAPPQLLVARAVAWQYSGAFGSRPYFRSEPVRPFEVARARSVAGRPVPGRSAVLRAPVPRSGTIAGWRSAFQRILAEESSYVRADRGSWRTDHAATWLVQQLARGDEGVNGVLVGIATTTKHTVAEAAKLAAAELVVRVQRGADLRSDLASALAAERVGYRLEPVLREMGTDADGLLLSLLLNGPDRWFAGKLLANRAEPVPPAAAPEFLKWLGNVSPGPRDAGVKGLTRIGLPAVPLIRAYLRSSDPKDRGKEEALEVLVALAQAHPELVPEVLAAVTDERFRTSEVLELVVRLGATAAPAVPAIAALLQSEWKSVRADAAEALAALGPAAVAARSELRAALQDEHAAVRKHAAVALGNLGDPAAAPVLEALFEVSERTWTWAGCRGLKALAASEPQLAVAALLRVAIKLSEQEGQFEQDQFRNVTNALGELPESAVPVLLDALTRPEAESIALGALDEMGERAAAAVPVLAERMRAGDVRARDALTRMGIAAAPVLRDSLLLNEELELGPVFAAIRNMGPAAAAAGPRMIALLADGSESVRAQAVDALLEIGPSVIPALLQRLPKAGEAERIAIVRTLGWMQQPAPAVLRACRSLAASRGPTKPFAVEAVRLLTIPDEPRTAGVLARLASDDHDAEKQALSELASFGPAARAALPELGRRRRADRWHVYSYGQVIRAIRGR